jgi:hypothetical protein
VSLKTNRAICMTSQIDFPTLKWRCEQSSASNLTGESPLRIPGVRVWDHRLCHRRLKHGVFRSIVELQAAINRFLEETNAELKPFVWTPHPDRIIVAVQRIRRGIQALESMHLGCEPINAEVAHGRRAALGRQRQFDGGRNRVG